MANSIAQKLKIKDGFALRTINADWFYISSLVFIAGGEINAILEHASADGKVPGARRAGEAPLPEEAIMQMLAEAIALRA